MSSSRAVEVFTSDGMEAFIEELTQVMEAQKREDGSASESSTTLRRSKKQKKKASESSKSEAVPHAHLAPSKYIKQNAVRSGYSGNLPEVKPFADLIRQHPEIFSSDEPVNQSGRKNKRTHADLVREMAIQDQQASEEKADPYVHRLFSDLLSRMPVPSYRSPGTPRDEVVEALKRKQLVLPCFTASYEERLLKESGKWFCKRTNRMVDYPACRHGDECVMVTIEFAGGKTNKIPYTAIMYPGELNNCETTGTPPLVTRECIQCHRYYVQAWSIFARIRKDVVATDPSLSFLLYYNPSNIHDGYASSFMTQPTPSNWTGVIDPVAQVRRHAQREVQEPGTGRWTLDCSAMKWQPPKKLSRVNGELHSDFCSRSAAYNDTHTGTWQESHAHRVASTTPCATALLEQRVFLVGELRQHERKLVAAYKDAPFPDPSMYEVCVSLDVVAPCTENGNQTHGIDKSAAIQPSLSSVVCQHTLPDLVYMLAGTSTWTQTEGGKNPFVKLFSKLWPQRCKIRMFAAGLARGLASNFAFKSIVTDMVLCSLLGNYEHVIHASRPLSTRVRRAMYAARKVDGEAFMKVLNDVRYAHTFLMRDWLVYAVSDTPALRLVLLSYFKWDEFCDIVASTTHSIRKIVSVAVEEGRLWPGPGLNSSDLQNLRKVCESGHAKILTVAFPRPQPTIHTHFHLAVSALRRFHGISPMTTTPAHRLALQDVVSRLEKGVHDPIGILAHVLPAFGASPEAVSLVKEFSKTKEPTRPMKACNLESLRRIAINHPYVYSLLSTMCELFRSISDLVVRPLPNHYRAAQLRALQRKYHGIPYEKLTFYLCLECGVRRFKSIVIKFTPPCKHSLNWCMGCRRPMTSGMNFCTIDMFDDVVRCKFSHKHGQKDAIDPDTMRVVDGLSLADLAVPGEVDHGGRPEATRVCLLGQSLCTNGVVVIICPRCASFMQYDPDLCIYTKDGAICARCTTEHRQATQAISRTDTSRPKNIDCVRCRGKRIPDHIDFHWFPCGVYVCERHFVHDYVLAVSKLNTLTYNSVVNAILRMQQELDSYRLADQKRYWSAQISRQRMAASRR